MLPTIVLVYKLLKNGKKMQTNIFLDKYKRLQQIILHTQTQTLTHVRTCVKKRERAELTRIFCRQTGFFRGFPPEQQTQTTSYKCILGKLLTDTLTPTISENNGDKLVKSSFFLLVLRATIVYNV